MQLKIVSLNIAGFRDWKTRKPQIVDFLDAEAADVVLLQEIKFDPKTSAYTQASMINQQLSHSYNYTQTTVSKFYQPSAGKAYREGLAILSRYPIVTSEALVLTKNLDDKHPRIVQNADLQLNDRILGISNIHLSNNQFSTEQLQELLDIFKARDEHRIIAGDFNIFDLSQPKDMYMADYTASVEFKKYTSFPTEDRTLDYSLIPKPYTYESIGVKEGLSDHNALVFNINVG